MNNNRKIGNAFERDFCQILFENGWWAYNCPMHSSGQPADIIAMKQHKMILADCKLCTRQGFSFFRVEDNQKSAMTMFEDRCHGEALFVFKLPDDTIYIYPWCAIECLSNQGVRFISVDYIREHGTPLYAFLEEDCL